MERVKFFDASRPLEDPNVKVAFCTTVFKRPSVAMALKINLALTWKRRRNITWHVVDFNKDDDFTNEMLHALEPAFRCGHLKMYRSDGLEHWHACIAKNTAHMLADETHHVLCNVDGDNLLTLDFVELCLSVGARIKEGSVGCAQFYSTCEAGTYGRIMIARSLFRKLGGYDETFHPVGCQDTDLIYRVLSCEGVGQTIRVDDASSVGSSIDNKPGASWSECIKQKVANTDPSKYSAWKFGFMDGENRTKMYELLQRGQVQRNIDKTIGCEATLIQHDEKEPYSENEDDAPDWGDVPHDTRQGLDGADDEENVQEVPEASPVVKSNILGGVTPRRFEFRISTFGLEKLAQIRRWNNKAANAIREAWLPSKGRAPTPINKDLIRDALRDNWGIPDVFIDARCFRPPPRDWTDGHCGFSYEMTRRFLQDDWQTFQNLWMNAMKDIKLHAGGVTPVNIVVYCRAGEKRSVGIAWLLGAALQAHAGGKMAEPIEHLCSRFWGRRTCAGWRCRECDLSSAKHQRLVMDLAAHTNISIN